MRGSLRHSDGVLPAWQVRHIVRLRTADGYEGLGDASPRIAPAALRSAVAGLVGADPFNLELIRLRLASEKFYRMDLANVAAAVQTACLDIQGRHTGQPVSALLGGRLRDRVPVMGYVFRKIGAGKLPSVTSDADLVGEARRLVGTYGFGTLKYKAGALTPEEDLAASIALLEAFPEHRLRIDPNAAWSLATALRFAPEYAALRPEWLEDPTFGLEGMAEFGRRTSIPTATNMCCIQPREFPAAVASRAFDVMLLDLWYLGGPWSARQMGATCRVFDVGLGVHSGGGSAETGIGLAAEAHLAASLPGHVHAIDTMNTELTDDIVTAPWSYSGGDLLVPDAPG
ncbi:MAG: enolase C-terminal domain-like protein, partial [Stackebrandtia sp.]